MRSKKPRENQRNNREDCRDDEELTTNPPGNEEPCVAYVESLLRDAGIESRRYEKVRGRPNLVARVRGRDAHANAEEEEADE